MNQSQNNVHLQHAIKLAKEASSDSERIALMRTICTCGITITEPTAQMINQELPESEFSAAMLAVLVPDDESEWNRFAMDLLYCRETLEFTREIVEIYEKGNEREQAKIDLFLPGHWDNLITLALDPNTPDRTRETACQLLLSETIFDTHIEAVFEKVMEIALAGLKTSTRPDSVEQTICFSQELLHLLQLILDEDDMFLQQCFDGEEWDRIAILVAAKAQQRKT